MEADQVLQLIMKKIKEYKANPIKSAHCEKDRQKNLKKMLRYYTMLKKRERMKKNSKKSVQIKDDSICISKKDDYFDESGTETNILYYAEDNENNDTKNFDDSFSEDSSKHNNVNHFTNNSELEDDVNDETNNTDEWIADSQEATINFDTKIEADMEYVEVPADSSDQELELPIVIIPEQIFVEENKEPLSQEPKEISDKDLNDKTDAVDRFLLQLREGLKRLPYRERSRLEIEFLHRLFEAEEQVHLPNNQLSKSKTSRVKIITLN